MLEPKITSTSIRQKNSCYKKWVEAATRCSSHATMRLNASIGNPGRTAKWPTKHRPIDRYRKGSALGHNTAR